MSISFIFTFGPVPLTGERSPLAHAAALVRRREAEARSLPSVSVKGRGGRIERKAEVAALV